MSSVVIRKLKRPSKRRLWQFLALTRKKNRTQFFEKSAGNLAREQSRTQFFGNNEASERLLDELAKTQALQNEKIVIFLDGQKYIVPRSKLLEWDSI